VSDTNNNRIQFWINSQSNGTTIAGDPAGNQKRNHRISFVSIQLMLSRYQWQCK
jgi:hypothetical protein